MLGRFATAAVGAEGRRALLVAMVVGTILNLINQGDALWLHHPVHLGKAALTFIVPYFVSLHGAAAAKRN